jgi:lipoate-protein ligase A
MTCRTPWRLIRSGALSGQLNMALDEVLLEEVAAGRSAPVLRLYRWDPATVTLGYFQRGAAVVNLEACRRLGLDVVRRLTGGRAVLHDREATYTLIAPQRCPPFVGSILENYRIIAGVLCQALSGFGLPVTLAPGRAGGSAGEGAEHSACFTAPNSYELLCHGCKISGGAQKRLGGAFLQHGSIPVDLDPELLFCALDTAGELSAVAGGKQLAARIGWLNRWLDEPLVVVAVEEALIAAFARVLHLNFMAEDPTPEEWEKARTLVAVKYGNPQWNLRGLSSSLV